jgi:hypothetical protein
LAELDKKHRDSGLVIIGAECQMSTKDEMEPILEKAKVEYTIVEGAEGPVDVTGIPRIFVFGADGVMVFDGRPSDPAFEKAVEDALEEAGGSADVDQEAVASNLIEEREWTNATGGKIRAAVQAADDSKVTFLMPNGKSVEYPLEKLSEESQEAIKEAYASAPADVVIYHTLEIRHAAFATPIRVVRDLVNLSATLEATAPTDPSTEVEFIGFSFDLKLPEVSTGGTPELVIEIDNASREILANIELSMATSTLLEGEPGTLKTNKMLPYLPCGGLDFNLV